MLNGLTSINLPPQTPVMGGVGDCFILKTCQRVLLLGFGEELVQFFQSRPSIVQKDSSLWRGPEAYRMALEILCGLQSRIVAESEVAAQFRKAYRDYAGRPCRNSLILSMLEKLLADAKKIRSNHLKEIGKQSYGGIVRKIIISQSRQKGRRLLIKGSGVLAEELVKLLKKSFPIYISARNVETLASLTERYGLFPLRWGESALYREFPLIINTVGAEDVLFPNEFFSSWHRLHERPLYVDLGCPSSIETSLEKEDGVWCLEDVLRSGQEWAEDSKEKVESAHQAIHYLLERRCRSFGIQYPFGWEELQFS